MTDLTPKYVIGKGIMRNKSSKTFKNKEQAVNYQQTGHRLGADVYLSEKKQFSTAPRSIFSIPFILASHITSYRFI